MKDNIRYMKVSHAILIVIVGCALGMFASDHLVEFMLQNPDLVWIPACVAIVWIWTLGYKMNYVHIVVDPQKLQNPPLLHEDETPSPSH